MGQATKTYVGVGLDNVNDGLQTGINIAKQAAQALEGLEPTIALLFVSHAAPKQVLKGVLQTLGNIALIGSTSAGEYSRMGYVEDGAGLMLIHSKRIQFHPLGYQPLWWRRSQSLLGQLIGTSDNGLGSRYNHRSLMLFPDDQSMNLHDVVERAMTETGMLYDILGGPSPTVKTPPSRPPAMFINGKLLTSGMVGAEILSQQAFGLSIANGWKPISGPYRVTASERGRIVKIDGRPAREIYEDFLLERGLSLSQLDGMALMQYPVGVCDEGDCQVSLAMGFDNDGALQVTSELGKNTLIHILSIEKDAITIAAQRSINTALQHSNISPAGLLFIDCMSTGMFLQESYVHQRQVVQEAVGDLPYLGFRSHGVLARLPGQLSGHYECSVGTWVIPR